MKRQISNLLDATVVGGFSRIGWEVRTRLGDFEALGDLTGQRIVVTGPTAGLGRATTLALASAGADLVLVGRDRTKLDDVIEQIRPLTGGNIDSHVADMSDLESVARVSHEITSSGRPVHSLVHNAGALLKARSTSPQEHETTLAAHVLGPFLMTRILLDVLAGNQGRVITVSSGGMYSAPLPNDPEAIDRAASSYNGTRQYSIAKRMQVTLNEMWPHERSDVWFAAMHPGWADTPGVQTSLPTFRKLTRPLLRTPEQGADTITWLTRTSADTDNTGKFWCDREVRPVHRLPSTRRSDTPANRRALWDWCVAMTETHND